MPTFIHHDGIIESTTSGAPPQASVIWLHGLGADGHDFVPLVPELHLPRSLSVRFLFPHAPIRPITLNGGMEMRGWYDIQSLDRSRITQDARGICSSQGIVEKLIQQERARGIPARRIVLAGFSQGGAIALHTGLRHAERLAGIIALSTYLPLADTLAAEQSAANRDIPILMVHGTQDPVISLEYASQSRDALSSAGYPLMWQTYPMPHSVCPEELQLISRWLQERLT